VLSESVKSRPKKVRVEKDESGFEGGGDHDRGKAGFIEADGRLSSAVDGATLDARVREVVPRKPTQLERVENLLDIASSPPKNMIVLLVPGLLISRGPTKRKEK